MSAEPLWSLNDGWRNLFEAADTLLSLPSVLNQITFIQNELTRMLGHPAEIFLIEEFKPLPHEHNLPFDKEFTCVKFVSPAECVKDFVKEDKSDSLLVSIPVEVPNQLIGYLQVRFPKNTTISGKFRQFLLSIGGYLAKVFEISRLGKLKEWRMEQLALVRSVNSEIVQIRDPQQLYRKIVDLIQSTFQFYFVALYIVDIKTNRIIYRSSAGKTLSEKQLFELAGSEGIAMGEGFIGLCADSMQECYAADVNLDVNYREVSGLEETQSELCLPLVIGGKTLGVLEILSDQTDRFHENDILVLRILSDNVALAIQNSGLIKDLLEQAWLSTMILQVSEASQRLESVEDLINEVARIIPMLIGAQKCGIFVRDDRSGEFILNAHYGFGKKEEAGLAMLPYAEEWTLLFNQLIIKKTALPFNHPLMSPRKNGKTRKNQCCGLIPMIAHERVFGAIVVDDLGETHSNVTMVSKADALLAVGRQTALAIENLRLEESRENEAYVNAILLQVAEMVASASDLNETMDNIISFLPLVVGVDTAFVYLLDEDRQRFHLNAKLSYQWKNQINRLPASIRFSPKKFLAQVLEKDSLFFFRVGSQPIENWIQVRAQDSLSETEIFIDPEPLLMIFPLFILDEKYGLLFVLESEKGFEYREKKAEIISGIAMHLSLAIQSDRLKKEMIDQERVQREFQLAREIQQTFLPESLPSIPGWEVSAHWRPALQVGGDFYDAFALDDKRIGLVIADVSDKGFPAALYMTVARTLIHAQALEGDPPGETLQRVNRLLMMNSQKGLFVTCLYAILSTATGDLIYANAGHNKPLWLHKTRGKVEWLSKGGMPLGVTENLELTDVPLQIKKGDHLLFYTDGVPDTRAPDDALFGEERLFNVLNVYKDMPYPSLIEAVDRKILEFRGEAPPSDDLTLLALHRMAN